MASKVTPASITVQPKIQSVVTSPHASVETLEHILKNSKKPNERAIAAARLEARRKLDF